ncbi:Crp/Fnr family transcriptional regulator [Kordiimonas marina]|uniref:Crp/Fnr family transcriptional regulator n=1 Tax=Kordiimonas marina TaxID=2872312 RepID=UPI001FF6A34F|nr:Crp/Fnr family transcriptional regulator [Kordiimonas marina]MCJ9428183.1 Crp/Fnr family transcriptional regulator [Kordiimonas marina]
MLDERNITLERVITDSGRIERFEKRSKIASRHQPLGSLYLVREGCLATTANLPCGRIFCPQIFVPGDYAPAFALIPGEIKVDMIALSRTTVTSVPRKTILAWLQDRPENQEWILRALRQNVLHCGMRGTVTNFGDATAKLTALIAEIWIRTHGNNIMPVAGEPIPLAMTQTHLSLVSGLSKAQVSRTLGDLCAAGYFLKDGDTLLINDAEFLRNAIRDLKAMLPCAG